MKNTERNLNNFSIVNTGRINWDAHRERLRQVTQEWMADQERELIESKKRKNLQDMLGII
jgi:hypothetical protein